MANTPSHITLPTGDLVSTFLPEVVSQDPSFLASIEQMTEALQTGLIPFGSQPGTAPIGGTGFLSQLNTLLIKPNLVNLSSDLINELGVEFQPPGYDQSLPLYQRIAMIQSACYDNAHLGTPASVAKLVNIVFGNAVVQEWWQYGGRPYRFRILTTDPVINPDHVAILNTAILATKPVSRWPDGVARIGGGDGTTYVGAAFFQVRVRRFPDVTV